MSVVVHVGQCGNQLGDAFWRLAADTNDLTRSRATAPSSQKKASKSSTAARPLAPAKSAIQPALYADQFFHRRSRRARCILVDTEPKVVRSITRKTTGSAYFEPGHVHYEQSGRGNNWAMGYNLQTHQRTVIPSKGSSRSTLLTGLATDSKTKKKLLLARDDAGEKRELVEQVMESLRVEIEALDTYRGTMLMHSLGGGTGAGLGSRLLETIRDVYPRSYLGAVSVAPSCTSGDTPLQNYNALFTLRYLQEHTDVVIYKENDELLKTASYWKTLVESGGASPRDEAHKKVTLREMNALVAADIAGLMFPTVSVHSRDHGGSIARPFDIAKLVHDCCPLPEAKFLDVRTGILRGSSSKTAKAVSDVGIDPLFHAIPATLTTSGSDNDESLLAKVAKHTVQSFPRFTSASRAIGASCIVRQIASAGASSSHSSTKPLIDAVTAGLPRLHLGNNVDVGFSSFAPFQDFNGKASVSIALNHGHALSSIRHFLDRGQKQFHANAYTHWYKQHGLEDNDFENAFEQCAQIVRGYEQLLRP